MKKFKHILLLCFLFIAPFWIVAQTRWDVLAVLDRWAVDGGKHLDWSGNTSYSTEWAIGINVWNNYKSGVIRADTWYNVNDLIVSDVSFISANVPARTQFYNSGKSDADIYFATSLMNQLTSMQKKIACTHEIGHALGLAENNNLGTSLIMYNDISTNTSNNVLSHDDKANYDYMYNNYY